VIELVLFRAGRALVVTLSALTLAHLLEHPTASPTTSGCGRS
jgi:hypothetical protein